MKKLLLLTIASLAVAGCVAVPVYDSAYYPYYDPNPYPHAYVGSDVHVLIPLVYGEHGFRGSYGFHGGHGFHRGRR